MQRRLVRLPSAELVSFFCPTRICARSGHNNDFGMLYRKAHLTLGPHRNVNTPPHQSVVLRTSGPEGRATLSQGVHSLALRGAVPREGG